MIFTILLLIFFFFLYDISTHGVCEIVYLDVLSSDVKKYNFSKFINSMDINLRILKMPFLENAREFNQKLINLKNSLPKSYLDYDAIIGDGDDYLIILKIWLWWNADKKTVIRIRNQVKKEYEKGELRD